MHPNRVRARALAGAAVAAASLTVVSSAWPHAEISPPETKSKTLQLFTLAVPTEKEGLTTTKIELTPPSGFAPASRTVTWSAVPNAVFTVVLCGEPAVALTLPADTGV